MTPALTYKYLSSGKYVSYPNRPHRGVFLHHTADQAAPPDPIPSNTGSWGVLFPDRDEIIIQAKPDWATFSVLKTDIFRPTWLLACPNGRVSDANYSADHWEIEYAPQAPYFEQPSQRQIDNVIWYASHMHLPIYGAVPFLGHGQVQSDKWPSEPDGFPWNLYFGTMQPYVGRFYTQPEEHMNPASDADIKNNLEQLEQGINPATSIMQFVYAAYRAGDPPFGNWRGPALPPGEYAATSHDGRSVIRHRFTAGVVEFDPQTGGLGWCEVVARPDEIQVP